MSLGKRAHVILKTMRIGIVMLKIPQHAISFKGTSTVPAHGPSKFVALTGAHILAYLARIIENILERFAYVKHFLHVRISEENKAPRTS